MQDDSIDVDRVILYCELLLIKSNLSVALPNFSLTCFCEYSTVL